ncbi:hypothetical protein JNUCC64_17655 [Streptomyces sp. JNUCC 64]
MLDDPVPLYVAGVTEQPAYRALVFAEGPVVGTARRGRAVLGAFASPYPGRVLRWLRGQALRIADGLDPDPSAWMNPQVLFPDPDAHPGDVPATLRDWALRDGVRNEARRRLLAGEPFAFLSSDHSGAYALTAWPLHSGRHHPAGGET